MRRSDRLTSPGLSSSGLSGPGLSSLGQARCRQSAAGFSLPELLVGMAVVGILASLALVGGGRSLARTRVEAASRELAVGLEQARSGAQGLGQPCAIALTHNGWAEPQGGDLPACPLSFGELGPGVSLRHNMAAALRISSNGLVLDGGTVVISAAGTDLQRCLVVSLPLGVVRIGRSSAAVTPAGGGTPSSRDCVVDPSL